MTSVEFKKQSGKLLYFLTLDSDISSKYCIAFLPNRFGSSGASSQTDASITLADSWKRDKGLYLFLNIAGKDLVQDGFVPALQYLMRKPSFEGTRFLWLENPLDPLSLWRSRTLSVEKSGGKSIVSRLSFLDLRNYSFSIAGGTSINLDDLEDPTGFKLIREPTNPESFELASGYGTHRLYTIDEQILLPMQKDFAGCVQFDFHVPLVSPPFGEGDIKNLPSLITKLQSKSDPVSQFIWESIDEGGQQTVADPDSTWIQKKLVLAQTLKKIIEGDLIYESTRFSDVTLRPITKALIEQQPKPTGQCLIRLNWLLLEDAYPLKLGAYVFGYPGLAHLDIGFRLFMRDPEFPDSGEHVYLSSHRYPLIDEESENCRAHAYYPEKIAFKACLDPINPLVPERTYLNFKSEDVAQTGLPSAYRTNLGYSVHFLPISDQSRLQFSLRPGTSKEEEQDQAPFYLVPAGEYSMVVPRYNEQGSVDLVPDANVICGLSGLEYFKITDTSTVNLIFEPGQPAFVPAYTSINALLRDLPKILKSFANRPLPPDTTDLDMKIEDNVPGLDITDKERLSILEIVRKDYFPPGYQFTQKQVDEYKGLEIVEDLINWLRIALQTATYKGAPEGSALTSQGTTSWVYVQSDNGAIYYAQPDQAPLYTAEASSQQFLDYLEIPSVGLPASLNESEMKSLISTTNIESLSFPMLPYGNVDPFSLTDIRQLEISLINNYRRHRIHEISAATNHVTALGDAGEANPIGTTPQGLIATFSTNFKKIERLQFMKDTKNQSISFVNIENKVPNKDPNNDPNKASDENEDNIPKSLKAALQSNQLFMVISNHKAISENFSSDALKPFSGVTNSLDIQDWLFQLGTEHWSKKGTILIFKFHDKSLLDLAVNPALWSLADDLNKDKAGVSQKLVRILKQAVEMGKSDDPKERRKYEVLARAATQPNWTGILALNVDVPPNSLPDSLKALAAGINPDMFYAQYVGVEVTPVNSTGTALEAQQSSLFGLIDYSNPNIPLADPSGYNFHVPLLSVVFRNSEIADFAAEVMIIMDRLFDEAITLWNSPNGKNILRLQGVAEDHNGKVTYSFGFSGANHFLLSGKVMQEVEIVKAQFATDPLPSPKPNPLSIKGRFIFWGRIRFAYLSDFDVLSFGPLPGTAIAPTPEPGKELPELDYLSVNNMQITMSFDLNQTTNEITNRIFAFNPNQLGFDLNRSGWRENSLYEKFPLKFTGLRVVQDDSQALTKSGYMPVKTPGKPAELGSSWYGLTFDLNLGSAGALAGSAGLVVSILAAWNPGEEGLYVGLKLPGSSGGKKEIVIQGLLKISFKSIQFVVYPLNEVEDPLALPKNSEHEVGYLLKIKNVMLKFFVLSFPPSGQTEFILFGDPREDMERQDKLLGWYAAYAR